MPGSNTDVSKSDKLVVYECPDNTNKTTRYKLVDVVDGHGLKALVSGRACSDSEEFTLAGAPSSPNEGVDLTSVLVSVPQTVFKTFAEAGFTADVKNDGLSTPP